jgi:hypothetical protein
MLAVAAVGLAAGYGGSSKGATLARTTTAPASAAPLAKAAYVREMTRIGHRLSADINALGSPTTAREAAAGLTRIQAEVRAAQRELASMAPPTPIRAAHERLTRAIGDFATELGPLIARLDRGDLAALATLTAVPAFREIGAATGTIVKAGYRINA